MLWGHGPRKVLVLNGWLGTASHWEELLRGLDPDLWQAGVMDYRGYGMRRSVPGSSFTLDEAAQDAVALADSLGWDRLALMGHSMGAIAMLRAAQRLGQRATCLLGLTPVSPFGSRMDAARREHFERAAHDIVVRQAIVHASAGNNMPASWSERVAAQSWNTSEPVAVAGYLAQWSGELAAGRVETKVHIALGEYDPGITEAAVRGGWLSLYPDASLTVLRGCGHYPMLQAPRSTAAWVTDALTSRRREGGVRANPA
ncbi:MAG TPA: alpha/beta hydrolase [Burkholderiaceae bacterium]|nr:alpha/beta hydrolase [Burkholderiaceae bacterium]